MPASRLLAAFAAGALVTVPGLALAQGGSPFETPPAETPPVEVPSPDVEEELEVEELDTEEEPEAQVEPEAEEEPEEAELEAEDEDDEGHGETISALAECLPSGAELHGTGFTKGFVISQAASTGTVTIEAHEEVDAFAVETPEDAEALCDVITTIAEDAEAPETAKGRPDWAGPDAGEDEGGDLGAEEAGDADRGGPPPWAGKPGGPKGPR